MSKEELLKTGRVKVSDNVDTCGKTITYTDEDNYDISVSNQGNLHVTVSDLLDLLVKAVNKRIENKLAANN